MAHLPKSPLGTTPFWTNAQLASLLLLSLLGLGTLSAQSADSAKPYSREDLAFDRQFFEAQALQQKGDQEEAVDLFQKLLEKRPDLALLHYELAKYYREEEEEDLARYHAEQAYDLKPANEWYRTNLEELYEAYGPVDKLIALYQKSLRQEGTRPEKRLKLAKVLLEQDQARQSLRHLDTLEDRLGTNEGITDLQRSIYLELGELDKAAAEIRELIEAYPRNMDYYGMLGQLYRANDQGEKALEVYQEMIKLDSTDPRPHLDLANYYRQQDQLEQSLHHLDFALRSDQLPLDKKIPVLQSLFNASALDSTLKARTLDLLEYLVKQPGDDARLYSMYGDYLHRDGQDSLALHYYRKTLDTPEGDKFQIWEQVLLLEVQEGWYDRLVEDASQARESFPNQPLPYLFEGLAQAQLKNYQKAEEILQAGLGYVFSNPRLRDQFYQQLAEVYHRLEQYQESDKYFDKALAINSENATVLNNYAYYLAQREASLSKALEMTQKSNQLQPDNPTFLDTWAWVLHKMERHEAAVEKMQRVLELSAEPDAEVLEHYGDILKAAGKDAMAREWYQKALEMAPEDKDLQQKIKQLP